MAMGRLAIITASCSSWLAGANSGQPALQFLHPAAGGTVTVNRQIMLDLVFANWTFAGDGDVCIDVGAELDCYGSPQQLAIAIQSPGLYNMKAHLVSKQLPTGRTLAARDRIVASTSIAFTAEEESACAHHFAQAPCGAFRPHCTLFPKFKFYLYPADTAPSAQAAALYITLRDHPMRTEQPEEACVFIAAGDVYAANTPGVNEFEGSRLYTRLQYWHNGENHLVFHYGDYAAKYDTGHAILARSSFGPPLDRAWFNPTHPELVPQMAQQRPGYDVVVPLPFYRCGMGEHTHLQRFLVHRTRGEVRPPSSRRLLLTFRGALYDFPESHHAYVRRLLPDIHDTAGGVAIVPTCWSVAPGCVCPGNPPNTACPLQNTTTSRDPRCAEWLARAESPELAFDRLLLDARFALIVPGEGTHSYRLYEALQAGAVPVILGESAMPLPEVIEWEDIAVISRDTSRHGLQALVARLRRMPDAAVDKMAQRGFEVFSANLKDLESQLSSTFATLAIRFAAAVAKRRGVMPVGGDGEAGTGAGGAAQQASGSRAEPSVAGHGAAAVLDPSTAAIDSDGIARVGHKRRQPSGVAGLPLAPDSAQRLPPAASASAYSLPPLGNAGTSLVQLSTHMWERFLGDPRVKDPASMGKQLDTGDVRRVAALLLQWLHNESRRTLEGGDSAREDLRRAYATLSQAYSVLGHWRHSATAAQMLAVFHPYDGSTAGDADNFVTLRNRNAMYDSRRRCSPEQGYKRPHVELGKHTLQRLYRTRDALLDADDGALSGYGALAGFLPPSPLGAVDSPSYVMPLLPALPRGQTPLLRGAAHPDTVLPFVGVDEATLQAIALRVSGGEGARARLLQDRLPAFRSGLLAAASPLQGLLHTDYLAEAPPRRAVQKEEGAAEGHAQRAGTVEEDEDERSRIAIVSLCAYDPAATKLAEFSVANLRAYCERHGYDCFVGTVVLDPRRPPAWSKILLVAQFLPSYEWVMWRDCDSFFMANDTRLEDVIAAAGAARGIIAAATAEEAAQAGGVVDESSRLEDMNFRAGGVGAITTSEHATLPAGAALAALASSSMDFIVSEDGLMLNTGVFFLRNSPWSHEFLAGAYGLRGRPSPPPSALHRSPADQLDGNGTLPLWQLGEDALSTLSSPSAATASGKREVVALKAAPLPFQTNRAWEQGAVLHQIAGAGTATTLLQGNASLTSAASLVIDPDALDALLGATADAGVATLLLPSFGAALHTQAVPQAWINSYPAEIAGRLHDHHGAPMHAVYQQGDWVVSFSGCAVLVGARECEDIFRHFAGVAAGAPGGPGL